MEIIKKIEQLGTSDGLVRIADCGEISEDKKKNALESDKGKKKKSVKKAISSDDDSSDGRVKKRRRSAVTDKRKKRRKYSSDSSSSDSDSESDSSDSDSYSESDSDSSSSSSDGRRRKKRSTKSKGKHRKNKQKESKKLKRPAKKSKRKSRRQMSTSTMGPNHERDRSMPHIEIQDLFHTIVADCYPELEAHSTYFPLKGKARKEYGDYAFFGVIDICRQLREKDPKLFDHTGPIAIANKINEKFESWKCDDDMIKRLSLNDAGILTFSLEGRWIAQRINNMLKDGIDTWAPTIFATNTRGKAVFIFPTNPGMGADIVRAIYIKDALANLCSYSGVDVGSGFCDDGARLKATKIHQTSLIGPSHDFYTDLGTFWYGANTQKADVMVYMTPHRLREYIEKCHITAANEGCLPDDWEGLLTCCGFRTFSGEQPELRDLWNRLEATWSLFPVECKAAGYTCRAFFECAFKFTCLKSHRLAECIFKFEDICDGEGNTFLSLLRTQALASSQVKDSDRNLFKLNVLAGKERELGLHLVEFTEVINRACGAFLPHVLCEYLCDLSKLFKCCYREVWPSENKLSLCEATKVVMNKCFELLGIALPTQSSDEWTKEFESFFKRKETRATKLHIIPSSEDARNEHPNSRFEIFSMNVSVAHSQFEEGNVTGCVTFVDKCRLADGDGWVMVDKNDDCHVSYFDREWYDAETIYNGSYIPLGNTSSVRSVPFSSTIEVALLIKATSKNNDQSYLIYNGSGSADLTKFWEDGALNTKCGTIEFNSEDGRILLDFVAIKDAVDTKMRLLFKPKFVKGEQLRLSDVQLRLSGSITASYGKDILGDCGFLGEYTAHIFRADPTKDYMRGPFSLPLHKSALAVPANGCLRVQANLVDLDTKKRIVDEVELCKSENGVSRWVINCGDKGDFELKVKWVH